jgi:multidrug efflux pump subunit AcrA (membrane-fusion protein)
MVAMRVRLDNPNHQLKKDMSAEIELEAQLAKLIVCPKKAVLEGKGQSHVFVKNSRGSFDERSVIIGADTDDFVEVRSGLKAGEIVAIDNLDRLRDEAGR